MVLSPASPPCLQLLEKGGIEDFADLLVQAVEEKHCRENSCRIKVAADAGSRSSRFDQYGNGRTNIYGQNIPYSPV